MPNNKDSVNHSAFGKLNAYANPSLIFEEKDAWEKAAAEKHVIQFEILEPVKKTAKLGGWEGKIKLSEDFNDPMEEFNEYM